MYAEKQFKKQFLRLNVWTWSRKVLKTEYYLDANIKTNEEVKIKKFKLLKHENFIFLQNSQPKQKFAFTY